MFRLAHSPVLHQPRCVLTDTAIVFVLVDFWFFPHLSFYVFVLRIEFFGIFIAKYVHKIYQFNAENLRNFIEQKKSFLIKSLQCFPMKSIRQQMTFNSKTNKTTLHSRCFIHKPSSLKTHAFDHTIQNLSNFRLATFARFQSTQFSEKWSAEPSWIKPIKHGKNVC